VVGFLLRRVAFLALVVLGAVAVVFVLARLIPADPARAALGPDASNAEVAQYRREMGLDRPLAVQFVRYLDGLSRGDLGRSIVTHNRVAEDLGEAVPATVELMGVSIVLSLAAGVVLGVVSAVRRGRPIDHAARAFSVLGMSLPVFWLGLVLQLVFYRDLSWLPSGGRLPPSMSPPPTVTGLYTVDALVAGQWNVWLQALRALVLPAVTLSTINVATVARITRASLLEVMRQDFVRTARAKGLQDRLVVYRHALRNAMIPVVTVFGLRVGVMFGGAVLTESIFDWPGVGRYAFYGLRQLDLPVVLAFVIYATCAYAAVNMAVDLSYSALDPRVRTD
jgi:peptide/nickel transport system permease protein